MYRVTLLGLIMLMLFASLAYGEETVYTYGDFQYEILEEGTVGIVGYIGDDEHLVIPAELDGKKVKVIGATNLKNSWKYRIDCDKTVSIDIEEGIEDLKPSTIDCRNLETIYLPGSLTCEMRGWSRMNPFIYCWALKEIKVAEDHEVFNVQNGALIDKNKRELIAYPKGRKGESVVIPEGVRRIGAYAYEGVHGINSIVIPEGVEEIGRYAFSFTDVESVNLPETLKKMEGSAFGSCKSLSYISIPKNMNVMNENPFSYCVSLKEIDVAKDHPELVKIDGALIQKESQKLVCMETGSKDCIIPEGVKSIADKAFSGMNMRTLTIPEGVETIGKAAFEGISGLKSIKFPESVRQIEKEALTYMAPEYARELDLVCYVSNEYVAKYCEAAGVKYEWSE